MADETKTQIPKPTRQRGPMGRMGGMRRGEKAKDFKGTMRQLLGYIGQHKIAVFAAVAFAVCSVIFNIVGPKVLGQVTTKLFEGLVAKVNGTGDVDFDWIAKTLGFLLCLYLASSVCSLIQGWLMTGVTQKICYRMRKEIAAKIAVVPMSYFNGHSKGDVLSRITNDVDTLGQSLNQSVTQLITSVTQIIGVLVMMLSISLPLTGVTVLTLPAAAIILTVMIHFSQPYFREQQQVLGAVNGIIEEDFAGQNVIQVFDRAEASIEEFDRQNDRLFISGWRSQFLSGLMMPLMSLVGNMGYDQPAAYRRHRAHAAGRRDYPDRNDSLLAAVLPRATAGSGRRQRHYRGGLCRPERHPGVRPRRGLDRGVRPSKRPPLY